MSHDMLLLVGEDYLCEISICSANTVLATSIAFVSMFSDTCEPCLCTF